MTPALVRCFVLMLQILVVAVLVVVDPQKHHA